MPRDKRRGQAGRTVRANVVLGSASTIGAVVATTVVSFAGREVLALPDIAMIYLVGIMLVAARFGSRYATFAALLSVASYDFFIVPPVFEFVVDDARHLLTFGAMFGLGLVVSRMMERLRQQEIRAREEELRSTLLSTVSHDLRTPLAVMAGAATTLRDEPGGLTADARTDLAQTICEEVDRLERLIDNLLDMTRLEFGRVKLKRRWVSLGEMIESAANRLERKLGERPVNVDLPEGAFLVFVDPALVEQVFVNLLENASKYTPPGSPIDIAGRVQAGTWEIEFGDRGPGIDRALSEKVFEKFYRGPHGSKPGAGLGLAICRSIVEAHGGSIIVDARQGGGAVFRISIPWLEQPELPEDSDDPVPTEESA